MAKTKKGIALGILSIISGPFIPVVGIALGTIGIIRANNTAANVLNIVGLGGSVLFWGLWSIAYIA